MCRRLNFSRSATLGKQLNTTVPRVMKQSGENAECWTRKDHISTVLLSRVFVGFAFVSELVN